MFQAHYIPSATLQRTAERPKSLDLLSSAPSPVNSEGYGLQYERLGLGASAVSS